MDTIQGIGPKYPNYPSQPYRGGKLPTMEEAGAPDFRYSSGTAPSYEAQIMSMYGRHLAGTDDQVQDEQAVPAWTSTELKMYAEEDDVQGSGIFDPPGTHPNIHPDAGIFAVNYSLPGYSARERPWSETEIRDVTTGRPIRAVPSGAVAMDSAAQIAFLENGLYKPPRPIINASRGGYMPGVNIANVVQNPVAIGQASTVAGQSLGKALLWSAVGGVALGALIGWMSKKRS